MKRVQTRVPANVATKSESKADAPKKKSRAAVPVKSGSRKSPQANGEDLATASHAPTVEKERDLERALGSQIRKLRRERDLSIVELATAADISIGMASKIENGAISPSLSTIKAVAAALHVPFSSLFSSFEERLDCSFVAKGNGMRIDRRGTKMGHVYELLGAVIGSDVMMEPYLITLEKGAVPYTGFRHAGVELIYMLSGEVRYQHAGRDFVMKPGDALVFDAAALHGPDKIISAPATYLSVIVYPRGASSASS